ncbi:MAG: NAD(P)/FAD-dependent oxidoreductase [Chitinophagaceae bacterium]|nr:MAG: NAD(P)/FAD-dependent oxidoreductase [Chitinophagaceae bacterium]
MKKHLVIVGGGAAGFFCAVNAARLHPLLQVTIIEKTHKLLSKVKVSGGGRCNVTNACGEISTMAKAYPRGEKFVKKTFHQFFTKDTFEWFQSRGVALKTEADGRVFPASNQSETIINCLLQEAAQYGVHIRVQTEVIGVHPLENGFEIITNNGSLNADFLCITTGGYPKLSQYDWMHHLKHQLVQPVPSLFTFNLPKHAITQLMGLSVGNAICKIPKYKLEQSGPLLITHWGLSGPCILKLSAWGAPSLAAAQWHFDVHINWCPQYNEQTLRQFILDFRNTNGAKKIAQKNPFDLPQRLWDYFILDAGVQSNANWSEMNAKAQNRLIKNLVDFVVAVQGKTTFKEEFVTAGGIDLAEIDANTMMSKKINHLYFAGEVLNIDGITGGYNFQNAWTTGFIVAKSIQI